MVHFKNKIKILNGNDKKHDFLKLLNIYFFNLIRCIENSDSYIPCTIALYKLWFSPLEIQVNDHLEFELRFNLIDLNLNCLKFFKSPAVLIFTVILGAFICLVVLNFGFRRHLNFQ